MEQIKFVVKSSSSDEHYEIVFTKTSEKLTVSCECEAAAHHRLCKHRLALLAGNPVGMIIDNEDDFDRVQGDLDRVQEWLKGTPLEAAYQALLLLLNLRSRRKRSLPQQNERLEGSWKVDFRFLKGGLKCFDICVCCFV